MPNQHYGTILHPKILKALSDVGVPTKLSGGFSSVPRLFLESVTRLSVLVACVYQWCSPAVGVLCLAKGERKKESYEHQLTTHLFMFTKTLLFSPEFRSSLCWAAILKEMSRHRSCVVIAMEEFFQPPPWGLVPPHSRWLTHKYTGTRHK